MIKAQGNPARKTINFILPDICEGCRDIDLGEEFRGPLKSDVTTLFVSGTLDGRTSVANAEKLIPGFTNSQHLIMMALGTAANSSCLHQKF